MRPARDRALTSTERPQLRVGGILQHVTVQADQEQARQLLLRVAEADISLD